MWWDGDKLASKSSNVAYNIPNFVYNAYSYQNIREYSIVIMSHGLIDEEVVKLTNVVNTYISN